MPIDVQLRSRLAPGRPPAHIKLPRQCPRLTRRGIVREAPDFPPALAAMIVLMVHGKPGALEHRPDPTHAVVAVIVVGADAVPDQEPPRRAVVHIYPEHPLGGSGVATRPLFLQRVAPVFRHAREPASP